MTSIIIPLLSILASIFVAYFTTRTTIRSNLMVGETLMRSLTERYFWALKFSYGKNHEIKQDALSKLQYLEELGNILDFFNTIHQSHYLTKIVRKHPMFFEALVLIRREHTALREEKDQFYINNSTACAFSILFEACHHPKERHHLTEFVAWVKDKTSNQTVGATA